MIAYRSKIIALTLSLGVTLTIYVFSSSLLTTFAVFLLAAGLSWAGLLGSSPNLVKEASEQRCYPQAKGFKANLKDFFTLRVKLTGESIAPVLAKAAKKGGVPSNIRIGPHALYAYAVGNSPVLPKLLPLADDPNVPIRAVINILPNITRGLPLREELILRVLGSNRATVGDFKDVCVEVSEFTDLFESMTTGDDRVRYELMCRIFSPSRVGRAHTPYPMSSSKESKAEALAYETAWEIIEGDVEVAYVMLSLLSERNVGSNRVESIMSLARTSRKLVT